MLAAVMLLSAAVALPQGTLAATAQQTEKLTYGEARVIYKAQKFFDAKDYSRCIQVLETYLQEAPETDHRDFFLLLGNSYYQLQDFGKAANVYARGVTSHPQDASLNLNLALALANNQQPQKAGRQFIKAYQVQQMQDSDLLYQAGAQFIKAKSYQEARTVLRQLLEKHQPAKQPWLELLLYACVETKNYDEAIHVTEQLLAQNPQQVTYWTYLAQLRLQQGKLPEAAAAFEVAYQYALPSATELHQLADLYSYLNLPLRAAGTLERGAEAKASRKGLEQLAELYRRGGRYDKADQYLQQVIDRWPDPQVYLQEAELLYDQSKYAEALQLLTTANRRYPNTPQMLLQMGFTAWQLENWQEARKCFTAARRFSDTRNSAESALTIIDGLNPKPATDSKEPPVATTSRRN